MNWEWLGFPFPYAFCINYVLCVDCLLGFGPRGLCSYGLMVEREEGIYCVDNSVLVCFVLLGRLRPGKVILVERG